MKTKKFSKVLKNVGNALAEHSPEILTGLGIAGMVSTVILAVKATPKALDIIEEEAANRSEDGSVPTISKLSSAVPKKDIIKLTWRCYIPAMISGVVSTGCLIGASSVNYKRNTALATAYSLSETALREYKSKVIETIGEKKETAICDAIAKDKLEKDPVSSKEIIITGKGEPLCYDAISGRYFKCDIDTLRKAENSLNHQMLTDMYVSLNDFYYEIGLSSTELGNQLGWNIDKGLIELSFSSQLTDDGTPCLVVDYRVTPKYGYSNLV